MQERRRDTSRCELNGCPNRPNSVFDCSAPKFDTGLRPSARPTAPKGRDHLVSNVIFGAALVPHTCPSTCRSVGFRCSTRIIRIIRFRWVRWIDECIWRFIQLSNGVALRTAPFAGLRPSSLHESRGPLIRKTVSVAFSYAYTCRIRGIPKHSLLLE